MVDATVVPTAEDQDMGARVVVARVVVARAVGDAMIAATRTATVSDAVGSDTDAMTGEIQAAAVSAETSVAGNAVMSAETTAAGVFSSVRRRLLRSDRAAPTPSVRLRSMS